MKRRRSAGVPFRSVEPTPHDTTDRPANHRRTAFHIGAAVFCLGLVMWLPVGALKWISGSFAVTSWSLEITRRCSPAWNEHLVRFFAPIAHPSERYVVNSSTWYMTALLLLSLTHDRVLCTVGVAVLGFGDPAAAWIGRRWGRTRLPKSRTLEGSLGFVAVATIMAWAMLSLVVPEVPGLLALQLAAVGATLGAVAEVVSGRIDDNISIPVAAAAGVWLVSGLPLAG